ELEATLASRTDELDRREKKQKREAERQEQTAERLDRHAEDLTERERALARLGQSLLSRRSENGAAEPEPQPVAHKPRESSFSDGIAALSAAAKSIRPRD
ncbi:MAG TPA: hypothetical protein VFP24_05820, partial [Gaiellaceae bacterium]|nr:hypothetical protein [Gaiellaceae bacterium]